jgi:hypothetical protein
MSIVGGEGEGIPRVWIERSSCQEHAILLKILVGMMGRSGTLKPLDLTTKSIL